MYMKTIELGPVSSEEAEKLSEILENLKVNFEIFSEEVLNLIPQVDVFRNGAAEKIFFFEIDNLDY